MASPPALVRLRCRTSGGGGSDPSSTEAAGAGLPVDVRIAFTRGTRWHRARRPVESTRPLAATRVEPFDAGCSRAAIGQLPEAGDAPRIVSAVTVWEAVTDAGRPVRFDPGDVLVTHGAAGDHCFAISSGEVLVTATSRQGATVVIARRGAGDVIGELGALSGRHRTATATAATAVEATRLTAAEFEARLLSDPALAVAELRRLAGQLRELTERYSVRSEEVRARILQVLETHAGATGEPTFRSTREELAGWVGATREAVTRALRDLERDGVVALARGTVELLAPTG